MNTSNRKRRLTLAQALLCEALRDWRCYTVVAPKTFTDDPDILTRSDLAERLAGTQWWVSIHDGKLEGLLGFDELIRFALRLAVTEVARNPRHDARNRKQTLKELRSRLDAAHIDDDAIRGLLHGLPIINYPGAFAPDRNHNQIAEGADHD